MTGPLTGEQVAEALNDIWGDFCGDTGCIPDCFTIHGPRTTQVEADFRKGNFASSVAALLSAYYTNNTQGGSDGNCQTFVGSFIFVP
jgi:hypothetical protein